MKHEFVLATDEAYFENFARPFQDANRVSKLPINDLVPIDIAGFCSYRRREELERSTNPLPYRHYATYAIITRNDLVEGRKYFVYQRGKGVGEARLAGDFSIGIGGHIDFVDAVHDDEFSFDATITTAVIRELLEEVRGVEINPHGGGSFPSRMSRYWFEQSVGQVRNNLFGYLLDDSNEVGKRHVGLVWILDLGNFVENDIVCSEANLITVGWKTTNEIRGMEKVESWSKILLDILDQYYE